MSKTTSEWSQEAFEVLAALNISVRWELSPSIKEQIASLLDAFPLTSWRDASVDPPPVGQWCIVVIDGIVQTHSCRLAMQDDEYVWEWSDTDADCCPIEQVSHWQTWPEFQKEQKG